MCVGAGHRTDTVPAAVAGRSAGRHGEQRPHEGAHRENVEKYDLQSDVRQFSDQYSRPVVSVVDVS